MKKTVAYLILALVYATCLQGQNLVKVKKEVSDFKKIYVANGIDLIVIPGETVSVEVECEKNCVDKIDAFVSNEVLKIQTSPELRTNTKPVIYVTNPKLYKITLSENNKLSTQGKLNLYELSLVVNGGCDVDMKLNINTNFICKIDGASKVKLMGNSGIFKGTLYSDAQLDMDLDADKIRCSIEEGTVANISGATDLIFANISMGGVLNAFGLQAEKAKVSIFGESEANVSVLRELHVIADGKCKVNYKGGPHRVKAEKSGGAMVVPVEE